MTRTIHTTREGWLIEAMQLLDDKFFKGNGYTLPEKLAISCGFPRGSAKAIGQCWSPKVAKDGTIHIFICPTQGDAMRVLDITLHEMIHAAVGLKEGHKGKFKSLAREFGLEGKLTATFVTPGSELHAKLATINTVLGPYPHDPLQGRKPAKEGKGGDEGDGDGEGDESKKRKPWPIYVSKRCPDYKVQIRPALVEEHGAPKDPWGETMVDKDAPAEPDGEEESGEE